MRFLKRSLAATKTSAAWAWRVARRLTWLWLLLILAFGAALRFSGLHWDEGTHVHPDERFLSMVAGDIRLPASAEEYFSVENSSLSPYNTNTFKNYLYGQFPLSLAKFAAVQWNRDSYGELYIVGRALSALADTLTIALVFLAAFLLRREREKVSSETNSQTLSQTHLRWKWAALTAAWLYAACVLSIQSAHYFTVESWLVFWNMATLCGVLALLRAQTRRAAIWALIACVIALAFTISCKASGVLVALPIVLAVAWRWGKTRRWGILLLVLLGGILSTALLYRVISPYTFASSSWLDWRPNSYLITSLQQQAMFVNGEAMMPPQWQWKISRPWISPTWNLLVWATGPFLGLASIAGICWFGRRAFDSRSATAARVGSVILLVFALGVWAFVSGRFVHSIRYLTPILPILCLAAAFFAAEAFRKRWLMWLACALVGIPTALYALAFASIYQRSITVVAATEYLFAQEPNGAVAAGEHWDMLVPLSRDERILQWKIIEVPVFDYDDETKIDKLYDKLKDAKYYTLATPRAWNTIGRLPADYPIMARFYQRLFAGELGFAEIAVFESPPQLETPLGIWKFRDLGAEEAFWVYDHPPTRIFRRTKNLSRAEFRALLEWGKTPPYPTHPEGSND